MTRWLYSLFMHVAWPFAVWRWRQRAKAEPLYGEHLAERAARYELSASLAAPHGQPLVWVHAVSLGETRAAASLVAALRQQWPATRLLLTHGTATGRAEGVKLLQAGDLQAWAPFDTPAATRRFFAHFKPTLGVLMETEVWPNWVAAAQQAQVPLVLVNARLSAKSLRSAQRLRALSAPAYAAFEQVLAQSEADAQRLAAAGAKPSAVQVAGNLKFDMAVNPAQLAAGQTWHQQWQQAWRELAPAASADRPVVMLASSREGEEATLLAAAQAMRHTWPSDAAPLWLLVPRHPQRFDEVFEAAQAQGWQVQRRSALADGLPAPDTEVLVGDSLGEMARYYGMADLALLGGSFGGTGGQNLIEAAACGCPLVMGSSTYNFAQAAEQAVAAGAAWQVPDVTAALQLSASLLRQPQALVRASAAGLAFAQAHRGAAQRMAQAIHALKP